MWMYNNAGGFPGSGSVVKNLPASSGDVGSTLGQEDPCRRKGQPTEVFLPGKSHGQRSLVGYSPWGLKESDMTEQLNNNSVTMLLFLWFILAHNGINSKYLHWNYIWMWLTHTLIPAELFVCEQNVPCILSDPQKSLLGPVKQILQLVQFLNTLMLRNNTKMLKGV